MVLEIGATVQMIKNLSDMAVKAIDSIQQISSTLVCMQGMNTQESY